MPNTKEYKGTLTRIWSLLERREFTNKVAMVLVGLAVICGLVTYGALTATEPLGNNPSTVFILLNIDAVVMLLLVAIITRRAIGLWIEHKRGVAGAKLHARLALIFALLAALPSALMILFATFFFHFGIQTWFSERISTAVLESQVVAQAYLKEHQQVIRADVLAMAQDLNRGATKLLGNEKLFQEFIRTQASLRNFSEVLVLHSNGQVIARAGLTFSLEIENPITEAMLKKAREGDVVLVTENLDNKVQAFVQLDNYFDTYVLVGRVIEPGVLEHMKRTDTAVQEYTAFELKKSQIQITITLLFVVVTLLLLVAAVWLGLSFAHNIVQPITRLINAAEKVRAGDLSVKVALDDARANDDEIAMLAKAFNRMTQRLSDQHMALDERRRFSEAVLSGVSAGVLGLDADGVITVANAQSSKLLGGQDENALLGRSLADVMPQMEALRRMVRRRPTTMLENEIVVEKDGEKPRTFVVRVAPEMVGDAIKGYVLTFDDISPLLDAQKNAAWSDVARRIAHEIKNPLTPIQLSAERLKRRYSNQIVEGMDVFDECIDTIVRKVDDMRQMVNEFSNFARMPSAKLGRENIVRLIQENMVLFKQSNKEMAFVVNVPNDAVWVMCDRGQFSQCLINVVKNAVEAIQEGGIKNGRIEVSLAVDVDASRVNVLIVDNGKGLPEDKKHQLTEPYITTREKGTGLGLAIVRKIMDDHGGTLKLANRFSDDGNKNDGNDNKGAVVTLGFAYNESIQNNDN